MPKTVTIPWDPAEHLKTGEDMAAHLEAALEEGNPALIAAALGDIARSKGMPQVAREAGLGSESLYKALSPSGTPEFATILKVVTALGLQLHAAPAGAKSGGVFVGHPVDRSLAMACDYRTYISRDEGVCGGEPVVAGTRVTVRTVLAGLAEGMTPEAIIADFPTLTEAAVRAVIAFAAVSAEEDLPLPALPGIA